MTNILSQLCRLIYSLER